MNTRIVSKVGGVIIATTLAIIIGCGGGQLNNEKLDVRPLEETKAFEIITQVLTERNYLLTNDVPIKLSTQAQFSCDFRVNGNRIAIEYLTQNDHLDIGDIPPAATGSRLHVLPARVVADDPSVQGESIYVFFINENEYVYHFNPTSDHRADVTFLEVDSRLRRNLADFLTWYENSKKQEK